VPSHARRHRSERIKYIVKAEDTRFDSVVLAVVRAQPLSNQVLQPIRILSLRRIGALLSERDHGRFGLAVLWVHWGEEA
jgi:hypothetical protein